eukprot:3676340-Prymnesium_polylepis.2
MRPRAASPTRRPGRRTTRGTTALPGRGQHRSGRMPGSALRRAARAACRTICAARAVRRPQGRA